MPGVGRPRCGPTGALGGPEKGYHHHIFMAFNSHNHEVKVKLPHAKKRDWQFAFSTARRAFTGKDPVVTIPEQCVAVWTATCS